MSIVIKKFVCRSEIYPKYFDQSL